MADELNRLVWTDLETMGLDPTMHPVMEIGFTITDLNLEVIDAHAVCVWESPAYEKFWEARAIDYVKEMHQKSGLLVECAAVGKPADEAEKEILEWLDGHGVKDRQEPLCGSSVAFDRSFLVTQHPAVEARFHYRNIDISSIKEICRRYNPRLYSRLDEQTSKKEMHRSLPDMLDTIGEFGFYLREFLLEDVTAL